MRVYTKKGKIKIEIAVAKGKTKADKRETMKKREVQKDIKRYIG